MNWKKTLAGWGLLAVFASALAFQGRDAAPDVEYLNPPGQTGRPFSEAVRVGSILFLSGQIGIDPSTGKLASGGIEAETRQVLENVKRTLEKYGSDMDHVVKCLVILSDMNDGAKMNSVYVTYFPKHLPARSAFGAAGLAAGARVEIECVATVK